MCTRIETIRLPKWRSQLNMLLAVPDRVPFQVAYYRSSAMTRLVDELAREPWDLAFGHMFRILPYLERIDAPRVLDLCDSLALNLERAMRVKPWFARPAFAQELSRVRRFERDAMGAVRETWVVTALDRADLLARDPTARVEVVPMGVSPTWGLAGLEGPKEDAVLFLGNLTVGHNVDAAIYLAEEIWPLVRKRRTGARLLLVGKLNARSRRLGNLPGVSTLGFVADLAPILSRARVSVTPIRYGAGIQTKLLETMAAGLPMVASELAAAPVGAEDGREILVGRTAAELADALVRVLSDDALARRIGEAGSRWVRARFSWERAGERLVELLG